MHHTFLSMRRVWNDVEVMSLWVVNEACDDLIHHVLRSLSKTSQHRVIKWVHWWHDTSTSYQSKTTTMYETINRINNMSVTKCVEKRSWVTTRWVWWYQHDHIHVVIIDTSRWLRCRMHTSTQSRAKWMSVLLTCCKLQVYLSLYTLYLWRALIHTTTHHLVKHHA
jgi:hypothetical protein